MQMLIKFFGNCCVCFIFFVFLQDVFHKPQHTLDIIRNLDSDCDTLISFSKIQKNVFFECSITSKYPKSNAKSIEIETFFGFDLPDFNDYIPCFGICSTKPEIGIKIAR
jgi:hypothetical protein